MKYSFFLLLLLACSCTKVQEEEQQIKIPFTQDDLTQIYSLAFDSLLGLPSNWLPEEYELGSDSLTFEVIFNANRDPEQYTDNVLLYRKSYCGKGKLCLQKYAGYNENEFEAIVQDSAWKLNKYVGPYSINSSYPYKIVRVEQGNGPYYGIEPYAAVYFETIAFSKTADYAIIIVNFYKDPEWGTGKAFYLKKEEGKWQVVGVNRLFIS